MRKIYLFFIVFLLSAIYGGIGGSLLSPDSRGDSVFAAEKGDSILVYCAAVGRVPVEELAKKFEKETGTRIEVQFGGSGTLLSNIQASGKGDLYIPIDTDYIDLLKQKQLCGEVFNIASTYPVIAVKKGNPKSVKSLKDLSSKNIRLCLANYQVASIGRVTKEIMEKAGLWKDISANVVVTKATVTDVANDIKLGTVDAGIIWNSMMVQYAELDKVDVPQFKGVNSILAAAVIKTSKKTETAVKFARFLQSKTGKAVFSANGYIVK
ncbi:MAG: molybdate ABC transporter substrate-binding protein [Firmicutes bacterium]|nr:molybdate ABC transporter substrate-binding protein [Bacillota bacterium]